MRYVTTKGAVTCLDSLFTIYAPVNFADDVPGDQERVGGIRRHGTVQAFGVGADLARHDGAVDRLGAWRASCRPRPARRKATVAAAGELRAYKIAGSFRHFGHNAPPAQVSVDGNGRANSTSVSYIRNLATTMSAPASPPLPATHVPLDGAAPAISAGTLVLAEGPLYPRLAVRPFWLFGSAPTYKRVIERRILAVDQQSLAWGPQNGASTVLTLERSLALTEGGPRSTMPTSATSPSIRSRVTRSA